MDRRRYAITARRVIISHWRFWFGLFCYCCCLICTITFFSSFLLQTTYRNGRGLPTTAEWKREKNKINREKNKIVLAKYYSGSETKTTLEQIAAVHGGRMNTSVRAWRPIEVNWSLYNAVVAVNRRCCRRRRRRRGRRGRCQRHRKRTSKHRALGVRFNDVSRLLPSQLTATGLLVVEIVVVGPIASSRRKFHAFVAETWCERMRIVSPAWISEMKKKSRYRMTIKFWSVLSTGLLCIISSCWKTNMQYIKYYSIADDRSSKYILTMRTKRTLYVSFIDTVRLASYVYILERRAFLTNFSNY